jgi:hypothetical protein
MKPLEKRVEDHLIVSNLLDRCEELRAHFNERIGAVPEDKADRKKCLRPLECRNNPIFKLSDRAPTISIMIFPSLLSRESSERHKRSANSSGRPLAPQDRAERPDALNHCVRAERRQQRLDFLMG